MELARALFIRLSVFTLYVCSSISLALHIPGQATTYDVFVDFGKIQHNDDDGYISTQHVGRSINLLQTWLLKPVRYSVLTIHHHCCIEDPCK